MSCTVINDCPGKRLLILVNDLGFFLSHRLPIAQAALAEGYDVRIGYGELGRVEPEVLKSIGFPTYYILMQRGGLNPFQQLRTLYSIWRLFRSLRPNLVHLVTIKPYLYGGIVARLANVPSVISAVGSPICGRLCLVDCSCFD